MIWNWLRRRPLLVDVALVGFLLLITIGAATRRPHPALAITLGIAETLPLLLRRQRPLAVVALVTAVAIAMIIVGVWLVPLQLGVALYTLAATREDPLARIGAAAAALAVAIALPLTGGIEFGNEAFRIILLAAAWALGDSIGSRRAYLSEVEARAERLEREQAAEVRRVTAEEQARIARELHDVVAHALSVIIVQAGAADDVFALDPARAREPIRAIDSAARAALGDLRRVLGILQTDADYLPQPSLARLDSLIEQVRGTGLEISLTIEGAPRPLPVTVDLSAYRIVQEALTNTIKHAGAARADVRVSYGDDLSLHIRDDGRSEETQKNSGGSGLVGMRERVALLGGTMEAGPAVSGGYLVSARIPIEGTA
jgi:signal transduction histidine kinase